jgi:hypothetical protein
MMKAALCRIFALLSAGTLVFGVEVNVKGTTVTGLDLAESGVEFFGGE